MTTHDALVPLAGDWELWRTFAVRSAGFPVSGLDAFGAGDESSRLRGVARDPLFREAVTWQNPAALENAVAKIAAGNGRKPSETRRREEIVASYWQRYCGKNDTIGFFGPLAWGEITDDGQPLALRSGALERERAVHLEAWGVQALAESIDPALKIAAGPHSERDLRRALDAHTDHRVRARGLAALDRFEAARDRLAAAPPESLRDALAALDATFVELTGRAPGRNPGKTYGARTLAYVDSMRDLDLTVGTGLLADLAPALEALFEATRWYCGEVHAIGRDVVERSVPGTGRIPFGPVLRQVIGTLMQPSTELSAVSAELQRRLGGVLATPDVTAIAPRAVEAFADHRPAWRTSVFQSVDLQLAAAGADAFARGEYLAVVGDVHPGANPLVQGFFGHRHPDPPTMRRFIGALVGPRLPMLLPPYGPGLAVDARGVPVTPDDAVHIAVMPDTRAQGARRTWLPDELVVEGDMLVDRSGELRLPLLDALGMPIFIAGVRNFELLPDEAHAPRVTLGRTVLRRESWTIPAHELPRDASDMPALARDRGMPRRLFAKSPLERKPMYLDVESAALARVLCRHARRLAEEAPSRPMRFTEMLPTPEQCWLTDSEGARYVSELRIVAVDRTRRPL